MVALLVAFADDRMKIQSSANISFAVPDSLAITLLLHDVGLPNIDFSRQLFLLLSILPIVRSMNLYQEHLRPILVLGILVNE